MFVHSNGGSATFNGCSFTGNSATQEGGAAHVEKGGSATFSGCSFISNSAYQGGAVAVFTGGSATFLTDLPGNSFSGNTGNTNIGKCFNFQYPSGPHQGTIVGTCG